LSTFSIEKKNGTQNKYVSKGKKEAHTNQGRATQLAQTRHTQPLEFRLLLNTDK